MMAGIDRGDRAVGRVDLAEADWQRNEYGVDVLTLSADSVTGAITLALRTPSGLEYPEREHFYTCDEDLYQFSGEFHHDEELPLFEGDYVYRPPGTVYGHSPGSTGGLIIAALNNRALRRWRDATQEVLVTAGHASLRKVDWFRGCYSFGGFVGQCDVNERLEMYVRLFLPPDARNKPARSIPGV